MPLSTTVHSIAEALEVYEMERNKRSGISLFDNLKEDSSVLELCVMAHKYNVHMGGSDANAQVRANYQSNIRANGWPWSLTVCLLLTGSVYNTYHLYKLICKDDVLDFMKR